jgi:type I restriction enzyme S subunit
MLTANPEKTTLRYIYHIMGNIGFSSDEHKRLWISRYSEIKIPVPPLPVQHEIVRILDNFTNLTAELTAELTARKKQYEYYQNQLLTFDNCQYFSLEELCYIVDYRGKTPKKVERGIFLVTAKNIRFGYIDYDKSQEFIAKNDYENVMRRGKVQLGDVLITTEAPCGNIALVDREDVALAQRVIKYRPKDNRIDSVFLKYILMGDEFQSKLMSAATGGTVKGIKGSKLHKLSIPVPDIEIQKEIVYILEKFNTLCNDISTGLPAEIEARRKQYEYYRDKLLTFKELA